LADTIERGYGSQCWKLEVTPSGKTLLACLLCSPEAGVCSWNFFHSALVSFFIRDSFIGVYLAGILRLPAESCFTLEIFDTLSLLRVLPFSPRNAINANPREYWRVGPIFLKFMQKTFLVSGIFLWKVTI
jgi:hypothetical protein